MQKIKKLMLTLAAVGALSAGAWAQGLAGRTFVDFQIEFRENPYTVIIPQSGELPAGVNIVGTTYNGGQHGVQGGTITVMVDGPIRFTIGGCTYSSTDITILKNGQPFETVNNHTACGETAFNFINYVIYEYNGEAAELTFQLGNTTFVPFFFAEAWAGPLVTLNASGDTATMTMPNNDVTATYELVRDISVATGFGVPTTVTAVAYQNGSYAPVHPFGITFYDSIAQADIANANDITLGYQQQQGNDWVATASGFDPATNLLPGTYRLTATGSGNYTEGPAVSQAFTVKAQPGLVWMYGNDPMDTEVGVTAYLGFSDAVMSSIGIMTNQDFNELWQINDNILRLGSTNPAVVSIGQNGWTVNGTGTCVIYAVADETDTHLRDSVSFPVTILAPATLTLATNNTAMGSVEMALAPVPVYTNALSMEDHPDQITMVDNNGDCGNYGHWEHVSFGAAYSYCSAKPADDWLISPAIAMEAGTTYTVSLEVWCANSAYPESFEVKAATGATADALTAGVEVIASTTVNNISPTQYTGTFTPTADGNYHIGIHATSDVDRTMLYVSNLAVTSPTLGLPAGVTATETAGVYRVVPGTEVTVNATAADALHHVQGWQDQAGTAMANATYGDYAVTTPQNLFPATSALTFTVTTDTTATAIFGINSYDVTATAALDSRAEAGTGLAMGTIGAIYTSQNGTANQIMAPDDTITFTAQGASQSKLMAHPRYGYRFKHWQKGSDTYTSDTLTLTEAATVVAIFVPDTFTVSASATIAAAGTILGTGRTAYRENATLEAQPSTGYHFALWQDSVQNILGTAATLTVQVLRDTALVAVMDTNVYSVGADVNIAGLGTVAGAGQVKHFLSTDLVATAGVGYHFVEWQNANGDVLGTDDTITVSPVSDTVLTAVFDTNIYATVWTGATTVTYNAQPQTGLGASYTDFWGNEHTPALTFTNGSTVITTPNYPTAAGTWTVTATGEEGDSLTNAETTLVIDRATVYVSGTEVETAKFADGDTRAVVTVRGSLTGVQGTDAVSHTTTANFSDATVGENKTITLTYALVGHSTLLANYNLTPDTVVYTTKGYIIEPMTPDVDRQGDDTTVVEDGMDIYAYGYCTGSTYGIRYHLSSGNPDQYKIDFADARFTDIPWTNLATGGADGVIEIDVPVDLPTGDYNLTVTFRDSRFTWLESNPITVSFHVNLPETYVMPLFNDLIAVVDTCHCLTDVQWYHRAPGATEWTLIPGATDYFYHEEGGLTGEYFVSAKMNGVPTYTCPQSDMETLISEEQPEVKAYPNPTTATVTITVSNSRKATHRLRVMSVTGVPLEDRSFDGTTTTIDMTGYQRGNYVVSIDDMVVRVIRN